MGVALTQAPSDQKSGGAIPFIFGSNLYEEPPFFTYVIKMDGNPHEIIQDITPGNFLSGVQVDVTSSGGSLGSADALVQDAPCSVFSSITFEDIDGGDITNPMSGKAYELKQDLLEPWRGIVELGSTYSKSVNPAFKLCICPEIRNTAGVLSNTDARAQYKIRMTVAPFVGGLVHTGTGSTSPTLTIKISVLEYAAPDAVALDGKTQIVPTPSGLSIVRQFQHEVPNLNSGTTPVRHTLLGNEIRGLIWVVRDSTGARINLTDAGAGSIELRLDNRRLWRKTASQIVAAMERFYPELRNGIWTRPTGVYCWPRFRNLGEDTGEYWMPTVAQNNLTLELQGGDLGSNAPGTIEIIYDQIAAPSDLSNEFEGL